jgi:hypothetical protein
MQSNPSDFIRSRAVFKDKNKQGGDKISLILGTDDVAQLVAKLQSTSTADGVRLQVNLTTFDGKEKASILISAAAAGKGGGTSTGGGFKPKSYKFAPKGKTIA